LKTSKTQNNLDALDSVSETSEFNIVCCYSQILITPWAGTCSCDNSFCFSWIQSKQRTCAHCGLICCFWGFRKASDRR